MLLVMVKLDLHFAWFVSRCVKYHHLRSPRRVAGFNVKTRKSKQQTLTAELIFCNTPVRTILFVNDKLLRWSYLTWTWDFMDDISSKLY